MPGLKGPKIGKEVEPPKGFESTISIGGTPWTVKYVTSLSMPPKGRLDGLNDPDKQTIWIVTRGNSRRFIADILWHELDHIKQTYWGPSIRRQKDLPALTDDELESLVLLDEHFQPSLLRSNPWFHALFGK